MSLAQRLTWGATVAAVDLPRPEAWQRLVDVAESSPGSTLMPVRRGSSGPTDAAGASLLTGVDAVSEWLGSVTGSGGPSATTGTPTAPCPSGPRRHSSSWSGSCPSSGRLNRALHQLEAVGFHVTLDRVGPTRAGSDAE